MSAPASLQRESCLYPGGRWLSLNCEPFDGGSCVLFTSVSVVTNKCWVHNQTMHVWLLKLLTGEAGALADRSGLSSNHSIPVHLSLLVCFPLCVCNCSLLEAPASSLSPPSMWSDSYLFICTSCPVLFLFFAAKSHLSDGGSWALCSLSHQYRRHDTQCVFFHGVVGPPDISNLLLKLRPALKYQCQPLTVVPFGWLAAVDTYLAQQGLWGASILKGLGVC